MKLRSFAVAVGVLMTMAPAASHGAAEGPWPLGTFVVQPGHPACLVDYTCAKFAITGCPNVSSDALGVLARGVPRNGQSVRGLVVFFSGSEGTDWWSTPDPLAGRFLARLRTLDGFVVVQVRWLDSWLKAPKGEESGSAHLACRPSTAVDWIYQNLYLPLGITAGPGECGFCITGNSGGATQAAYPLSHYGLDGILGAAVLTSGPPHAAEEKGCLPGFPGYEYDPSGVKVIDLSFGFSDDGSDLGPCFRADPSWSARWQEESVDTGANDTAYPRTRVDFIIGSGDDSTAPIHAGDFRDLIQPVQSNHVTWLVVDGMAHTIQVSPEGLAALEASLLGP